MTPRAWLASIASIAVAASCGTAEPASVPDAAGQRPAHALPWPADLSDLAWLEGRWIGRDAGGTCFVEEWLGAAGGSVWGAGVHRRGEAVTREVMRVVADEGRAAGLVMHVMLPSGQTTTFDAAAVGDGLVHFERRGAPDFPKTIHYRRGDDGGMRVLLAGDPGETLVIAFRRAAADASCDLPAR